MHLCGIPYILLEGKLEDWEKILQKLNYLSKFIENKRNIFEDLIYEIPKDEFPIDKMKKNIEEIINTKKGNINIEFWKTIIMETNITFYKALETYKYIEVEEKVIRGWICDFYPAMKMDAKKNSNDLVDEILEVSLKVMQDETKEIRNYIIYTGITDLKQDPDTFIVEPIVNYRFSVDNSNNDEANEDWFLKDL